MTHAYEDRLIPERYAGDELVEFRAAKAIHSLPARLFARIQLIASAYELHLLPAIDYYGSVPLAPMQCETLVEELEFVRARVNDPLIDDHLKQLVPVALSGARSSRDIGLLIEGP